jgi:hypothetical protein
VNDAKLPAGLGMKLYNRIQPAQAFVRYDQFNASQAPLF